MIMHKSLNNKVLDDLNWHILEELQKNGRLPAVEIGRRSWTLNRNWSTGMTYVVAGLGQLGRIAEARAALADYKELFFADLASWERLVRRLFPDPTPLDHIAEGLRKAGFE